MNSEKNDESDFLYTQGEVSHSIPLHMRLIISATNLSFPKLVKNFIVMCSKPGLRTN